MATTVPNSWLVDVNVSLNVALTQAPNFNNCLVVGVMPTQSSPYQSPPSTWGGNIYQLYTSYSQLNTDFSTLLAAAEFAGDIQQANRFQWIINAGQAFFAQQPTPSQLYLAAIPPQTGGTNYTTYFNTLTGLQNNWYGFTVADWIPPDAYSELTAVIATTTSCTLPAGTALTFQGPTPTHAYVTKQPYTLGALGTFNIPFYSSDVVTPVGLSSCVITVVVTMTGAHTLPIGWTVHGGPSTTAPYQLLAAFPMSATGTYSVTVYSTDTTTAVPPSSFTTEDAVSGVTFTSVNNAAAALLGGVSGISPSISGVTASNTAQANLGIPGLDTPTTGLVAALVGLRSNANNQKKLFLDTLDPTVAEAVQTAGGSEDMAIFYHSLNLQAWSATTDVSLSAACLSEYFTDLFSAGVGMKPLSSMSLQGTQTDPAVTGSNIGTPGQTGSSTNLIGWNNNLYPAFGAAPGQGLVQWGYVSSSKPTSDQIYLDQVVGADYLQLTAQADLVTFITNAQPVGGVPYSDLGIQQILTVFKGSVQKAVNQNILQQPQNSAYVYLNYAQVSPTKVANRIYNDLTFNGTFLSRIQQIAVNVNLSI